MKATLKMNKRRTAAMTLCLGLSLGFGLLGMIERVRLLGGESQLDSTPGAGTRIVMRLPISLKEASP